MSALHANPLPFAGDISPQEAWDALQAQPTAQLIDVRTQPEWMFAGLPDLRSIGKEVATVSWKFYPSFTLNPDFVSQLEAAVPDKSAPVYFLCKTGGRSLDAAIAATAAGYTQAYNVAGGFEGDMNNLHQRGKVNGWKAVNLPWFQA
jgi:rhodanese-related sulfurtransferase